MNNFNVLATIKNHVRRLWEVEIFHLHQNAFISVIIMSLKGIDIHMKLRHLLRF